MNAAQYARLRSSKILVKTIKDTMQFAKAIKLLKVMTAMTMLPLQGPVVIVIYLKKQMIRLRESLFPVSMDESTFISSELYEFLLSSLPNIVKGCQWTLLYSTLKHGISLHTLIRKSAAVSGPCLLITGDRQGAVFGGLLECPLKPTAKRKYQGTNQSFVFTTIYGEPRIFRPTGANRYYFLCLNDILALGGGGNFALCLDGDLLNGTSGPCQTFGNLCLAHNPEFELKNVEVWGFTHASKYLT
ncbi:TLD-DOMAIN CONTAINING NUCLEOLAR PROTEIN [Salix purpurea]|uniref:TLD-DOMAIN CONTAINING NUCLEOLAR PROTEIN n=1 Tax=Salix purpurea TaxID=77065 RepID=A0A9Q0TX09_SALPP|nr:TLD-DOMAIN CONTAINING NUCLEOLAR PROTEIN [Salix purpurea]KAJ6719357.1 TLD-DOMAIN CONTAINING NUCLEOLAR PROTEIN [Salix purpurea]